MPAHGSTEGDNVTALEGIHSSAAEDMLQELMMLAKGSTED